MKSTDTKRASPALPNQFFFWVFLKHRTTVSYGTFDASGVSKVSKGYQRVSNDRHVPFLRVLEWHEVGMGIYVSLLDILRAPVPTMHRSLRPLEILVERTHPEVAIGSSTPRF